MGQNRKARLAERRSFAIGLARRILHRVVSGDLDAYEGCGQVRTMYLDESELLRDLEPLANVGSSQSAEEIRAMAQEWLAQHPTVA
jgi:hypothetical protein